MKQGRCRFTSALQGNAGLPARYSVMPAYQRTGLLARCSVMQVYQRVRQEQMPAGPSSLPSAEQLVTLSCTAEQFMLSNS